MLLKLTLTSYDIMKRLKNNSDADCKQTWEEEISTDSRCLADAPEGLTPWDYAQLVIDYFNDTLKPGELRRELVGVKKI